MNELEERFRENDGEYTIIYKGLLVMVRKREASDGQRAALHMYVLAKDPAGQPYFQFESSCGLDAGTPRGEAAVVLAFLKELKEKA